MPITIKDQPIRDRALDPSRSFIVQAPAGSGKTEILSQRYLVLLSHAQKAPEEIVAITFTKKAAAEMRIRIIKALEFGQAPEPDKNDYRHTTWRLAQAVLKKDQQLEWQLLENPNRLRILTIDALSSFLCRQTPILTQIGAAPDICDNPSALYTLAAQRLITDLSHDEQWQPILEHVLLHLDNHVTKLETLLSNLLAQRDQWLPHIVYCYQNQHALRELLENSLKNVVLEKMQLAAQTLPTQAKQTIVLLARHAGNYFCDNHIEHAVSACADFTWEAKPALDKFPIWFGLAKLFLTGDNELRKTVNVKNGFAPKDDNKSLMVSLLKELETHDAFIESLADIANCPPTTYTDTQWETITALTQILPLLVAQLTLTFQEKGQVDFVELNLSALRALGNEESPTDLALYLDYQIRHLLIDEFQDTSVTQLHLLEKITAEWEQNDGRTLFVVGDPMQSIYRFRNAEVGLFMRAQEQGIGHIPLEPLTLLMNFRSQQKLVDWFNDAFSLIFPAVSDIPTGRVPYTPAIAARSETNDQVFFHPLMNQDDNEEANVIVENIRAIKNNQPTESIAILVRSRSHLKTIVDALRAHELAFQAVDIEALVDRIEIQDLLSLTRALLHRADRIAWLALLRAPWCGLTLNDLALLSTGSEKCTVFELMRNSETLALLSTDGQQRIQRIKHLFHDAFLKQHTLALSQWIEGVWIALGGPACLTDQTSLQHTRAFFQLIEKLENESLLFSVDRLMEHCKKLFANADSTHNAIQIMTIHKSKGLEFDHVFLPGLDHGSPANDSALFRWCDRPNAFGGDDLLLAPIKSTADKADAIYSYLNLIENQKQTHEMTRLIYVAATRARKSLHLLAHINVEAVINSKLPAKSNSFLAKLWPACESMMPALSLEQKKNSLAEDVQEIASPAPLHSRLTSDWHLPALTNYSHTLQNQFELNETVTLNIDLQPQQSRIVGTVIHRVLQEIAQTQRYLVDAEFPVAQWTAELTTLGLLPSDKAAALHSIRTAITTTLADERGRWLLSPHTDARCELALTHRSGSAAEHVIIDRTFVDENKVRWIIDYKTAAPADGETMATFLEKQKQTYQKQLDNYAAIMAEKETRPIYCGLYFPLCAQWIAWGFKAVHAEARA